MTQALPLEDRVAKLEREMAEVQFMTGRTDREVSDLQAVLNGHTGVLNAIREDQRDQGKRLARVEAEMRSGFADVRAEMRTGFDTLARGQDQITELLTRHLDEPNDEAQVDGAGE